MLIPCHHGHFTLVKHITNILAIGSEPPACGSDSCAGGNPDFIGERGARGMLRRAFCKYWEEYADVGEEPSDFVVGSEREICEGLARSVL